MKNTLFGNAHQASSRIFFRISNKAGIMPDEPIIPFMPCFTNALEFTFITSDQINHITLIIIIYDYIMLITLS